MAPPSWKRRLFIALRWSFLIDAIIAAMFSLLTAVKWPVWTHAMGQTWQIGMVVPEISPWLALLVVAFAIAAVAFRRRGKWILVTTTITLCGVAFVLYCKPAVQAWQLGRTLNARLISAFGPPRVPVQDAPFSLCAAFFGHNPEPVRIETMSYAAGLSLDFYRAVGRARAPCVIVIHGGSWVSGNRFDDATKRSLNDRLARRGYAIASIDYRLAPQFIWPAQRDDLLAAIRFLRHQSAGLGIDPDQLVLLGRSAGAQIAIATACARPDLGLRGVIDIYGPSDFDKTWESATRPHNLDHRYNLDLFLGGSRESAPEAYRTASGARLVTPAAPPMLILQGDLDINVFKEQAELLDQNLAQAAVPHALVSLPWAAHAFDLVHLNTPGGQIGAYAIERFLASVTH